jgi:ketosteroid isomerase-like protein
VEPSKKNIHIMTTEANKAIATAFFEHANTGDMESSLQLLSDDLVWTGVGTASLSGTYRGKQAVMGELMGPLFSQLKQGIYTDIDHIIAEGDHVVVQASGKAETLQGVAYNNSYCFVFKILDGKICEVTEYCDTLLASKVFP